MVRILPKISSQTQNCPKSVKKVSALQKTNGTVLKWKDENDVPVIPSFHDMALIPKKTWVCVCVAIMKPNCVHDCNATKCDNGFKDQNCSPSYSLKTKRGKKWYLKFFTRILTVTVHNANTIYSTKTKESIT